MCNVAQEKNLSAKEKYKKICKMRAAPSSSSDILKLHESSDIRKITALTSAVGIVKGGGV